VRARVLAVALSLGALLASAGQAEQRVRMVILPVVVNRDSMDSSYVSQGLAEMLSARLEQIGGIEVIRIDDMAQATTRLAKAREAAKQVSGDYVLFGSFTQFGDGASLDVQCASLHSTGSEGESVRRVFIQSGTMGDIIPKLDRLVDKVAVFLKDAGAIEGSVDVAQGGDAEAAAQDSGESADAIRQLRERIDALERVVYQKSAPDAADAAKLDNAKGKAPES
jgi:TolB-like protein